ncbi:SCO family protein [Thalassospira sp.]|uniref:SCO family protein n=1 Tax=Thalassospira sp. TaxID=1912094 RepID=UPI0027361172|nr:SCO family protein [Thalassospira sp.]MDP2700425.1 SCO family protein [Thalassospira sp.]
MQRRTLLVVVAIVLVLGIGFGYRLLGVGGHAPVSSAVTSTGTASIGGSFELIDQAGQTRTEQDFAGKYMLVYFGYTFCPDVCPTELQAMSAGLDLLDADVAQQVQPIFITVDPERDDVEAMASYVPHFHDRLIGLTGTEAQTTAAAKAYRVYYAKAFDEGQAEDSDAYLMDHSSFIYLMGPDGQYVRHFNYGETPENIAAGITKVVENS